MLEYPGDRVPGVSPWTGGRAVVAWQALTVVEFVVGLLLAAVSRDAVDLHPHEGVHDGAPLLPVQLGQLLRCDHLGAEGAGASSTGHHGAVGPRRRDLGGTWVGARTGLTFPGEGSWPGMGMGTVSPKSRDIDGTQTDARTGSVSPQEKLVAPRRRYASGTWLAMGLVAP